LPAKVHFYNVTPDATIHLLRNKTMQLRQRKR